METEGDKTVLSSRKKSRILSIVDASKYITRSITKVFENSSNQSFKKQCLKTMQVDDFEELQEKTSRRLRKLLKRQINIPPKKNNDENVKTSESENSSKKETQNNFPIRNRLRTSPLQSVPPNPSTIENAEALVPSLDPFEKILKRPNKRRHEANCKSNLSNSGRLIPVTCDRNVQQQIPESPSSQETSRRSINRGIQSHTNSLTESNEFETILIRDIKTSDRKENFENVDNCKKKFHESNYFDGMIHQLQCEDIDTTLLCNFINGTQENQIECLSPILKNSQNSVKTTPKAFSCSSPCESNKLPPFHKVYGLQAKDNENPEKSTASTNYENNTISGTSMLQFNVSHQEHLQNDPIMTPSRDTKNEQLLKETNSKDEIDFRESILTDSVSELCRDFTLDFPLLKMENDAREEISRIDNHVVPDQDDWLKAFENDEFWCQNENVADVDIDVFALPTEELFKIEGENKIY